MNKRGRKRKVMAMDATMTKLQVYNSTCECAREMGLKQQTVYNYLKSGKQHKSGYYFSFAE